jgi:hypothetical protein
VAARAAETCPQLRIARGRSRWATAVIQLGKQIGDDSVFLTIRGEDLDQSAGSTYAAADARLLGGLMSAMHQVLRRPATRPLIQARSRLSSGVRESQMTSLTG